jgi:membrane protease YdiL (CAAX protease family)
MPHNRLSRFFISEDAEYDAFVTRYQAKTLTAKASCLGLHLLPGMLLYVLINCPPVHAAVLRATGISDLSLQGWSVVAVLLGWHLVTPFAVLRWADKLSFRDSVAFLSLGRFDVKGLFVILPIVFAVFTVVSIPYMQYVFPVLSDWITRVPGLNPPAYSIYRDPTKVYGLFSAWVVALGLVGNFLGEEVYFRGYLLKKIGFLGGWAWVVNSMLFALYHMWQAPTTWALIGPAFVFGLLMRWRKNTYPLIAFHCLINIVWSAIIGALT